MKNHCDHKAIPRDIGKYLSYNPLTGIIGWIDSYSRTRKHIGRHWGTKYKGYLRGKFRDDLFLIHRVAWFLQTGDDPGVLTPDHIDGDGLNNKWENLRLPESRSLQNRNLGALNASLLTPNGLSYLLLEVALTKSAAN